MRKIFHWFVFYISLLVLLGDNFAEAGEVRQVQVSGWKVERVQSNGEAEPVCSATTQIMFPDATFFENRFVLRFKSDGNVTAEEIMSDLPEWFTGGGKKKVPSERYDGCRYWFDAGTMHPMIFTQHYSSGRCECEFRTEGTFLNDLNSAKTLNIEPSPGAIRIEQGRRILVNGKSIYTYMLDGMHELANAVVDCQSSITNNKQFEPIFISNDSQCAEKQPSPMPTRIKAMREVFNQRQDNNNAAWREAMLEAGNTAADALRLSDASKAFSFLLNTRNSRALNNDEQKGLERLIEVLFLSERFDEAKSAAKLVQDCEAAEGAIALAHGDDLIAEQLFSKAVKHASMGNNISSLQDLSFLSNSKIPLDQSDAVSAKMRRIIIWWGLAALGQERWSRDSGGGDIVGLGILSPASVIPIDLGRWLDGRMLRDGSANVPSHRRDLGIGAYIRGASLLKAGYLEDVPLSLAYAKLELEGGSGADGWAARARLAEAELLAARGLITKAKEKVDSATRDIEVELGKESLPWLEAMAIRSELATRLEDYPGGEAIAREGLAFLPSCLPKGHSLHLRLARALASSLSCQGRITEAITAAIDVMEFDPPANPPIMFRVLRQMLAGQKVSEQGAREFASAISAPPPSMPLSIRAERLEFIPLLSRLSLKVADPEAAKVLAFFASRILIAGKLVADDDYAAKLRENADANWPSPWAFAGIPPKAARDLGLLAISEKSKSWLLLDNMYPSSARRSLLPGAMQQGLENVFDALQSSNKKEKFDIAMLHVQAAARGIVLANLAARSELNNITLSDTSFGSSLTRDKGQALVGDLWVRRQRCILLDMLRMNSKNSTAAIRRLYYPIQLFKLDLYNKTRGGIVKNFRFTKSDDGSLTSDYENTIFWSSQIQDRLNKDDAMIVWLPLEHSTQIFVITSSSKRWLTAPDGQVSIGRRVQTIRQNINEAIINNSATSFPIAEARALYRTLFGPIEKDLVGMKNLYTVQLGSLGNLPLGLLAGERTLKDGEPDWLLNRFSITRLPALINPAVFEERRPTAPLNSMQLLAVGDPIVDGSQVGILRSVAHLNRLDILENARREMTSVKNTLQKTGKGQQIELAGPQATYENVVGSLRKAKFQYLLFATHGLVGGEDVGEPALVLSPSDGGRRPDNPGLLRASDVIGLELDTDLVILSACETSPSGEDGGEPLAGLAAAFLTAGARDVLATQWAVATEAAERISTETVDLIQKQKIRPAQALQVIFKRIQAEYPPGSIERHPLYWAPFEDISFPPKH
ncbi:MAG TPA: hypothetical protein DDZ34_04735 [Syntrophaceae bacterium]|nr:hypothetical protein [Syntrophaceae bacterium]